MSVESVVKEYDYIETQNSLRAMLNWFLRPDSDNLSVS